MVAHVSLLPLAALLRVSKRLASTKDAASAFYSSQLKPKRKEAITRLKGILKLCHLLLSPPAPITHLPSQWSVKHWGLQLQRAGEKALVLAKREESVRERKT